MYNESFIFGIILKEIGVKKKTYSLMLLLLNKIVTALNEGKIIGNG